MNILIKNADFSEVSIGKVDTVITLEKKSIITHAYLISTGTPSYISSNLKLFAVDVSSLVGRTIEIKGYLGSTKVLGVFYSGNCPTEDITFESDADASSFVGLMGEKISALKYPDDSSEITTKTYVIPNGAKTLIVNVGSSDIDELYVKYSLI